MIGRLLVKTNAVRLLVALASKPLTSRMAELLDALAELGVLQRRGVEYIGARDVDVEHYATTVFDNVVLPYLFGERPRLDLETRAALHALVHMAWTAERIDFVQRFLRPGGLALVAGWFPCGFGAELISIAGMDVVIYDRYELYEREMERLSVLPLSASPIAEIFSSSAFVAFEEGDLTKYGTFDVAIVCGRETDAEFSAAEIWYIDTRDPMEHLLLRALGLKPLRLEDCTQWHGMCVKRQYASLE